MKDINSKLAENEKKLVSAVSEFTGKPVEEIKNILIDILPVAKQLAEQKLQKAAELLALLEEKTQLETGQEAQEQEQKFLITEKEVLSSLPETEQQRIATMRSWLQKEYGDRYKTSYKQVIMKLYNKEVAIGADSVQFLYAHKELDKKELQLSKNSENIYDTTYTDFDGKDITRKEIRQRVLDEDNKEYHYIQEAQEKLNQQNKYIATEKNTFNAILGGFEGTVEQKIKAMQFLTGFVGRGIISLEKDKNDFRRFLESNRYEDYTTIFDNDHPSSYGSLFVAKDC